jgi:ribosome-associated protein
MRYRFTEMNPGQLTEAAAGIIVDKLGDDVLVLDLRGHSPLADYFVLATAGSSIHSLAIAEELQVRLKQDGERPHHVEGTDSGLWVLLDYFDVVVHIFLGETRQFYGLERLWGDAPRRSFSSNDDRE